MQWKSENKADSEYFNAFSDFNDQIKWLETL